MRSKVTSIILAAAYFFTNAVFIHAAESSLWEERRRAVEKRRSESPLLLADARSGAALPAASVLKGLPPVESKPLARLSPALAEQLERDASPAAGRIKDVVRSLSPAHGAVRGIAIGSWKWAAGRQQPIVVHIHDVHMNAEAQGHIGGAVEDLLASGQVAVIGLEGAFEPVDVERYRVYPDRDVIETVADHLLRTGKISGPVRAAMTSRHAVPPIAGVDDPAHYEANVEAYRRSSGLQKEYKERLARMSLALEARKAAAFNPALKEYDARVQAYRLGGRSLGEHARFLSSRPGAAPSATVRTFLQALDMETALDFRKVDRERTALVEALVARLDKAQLQELLDQSLSYRLGKVTHTGYYRSLRDLCAERGVPLAEYPAMDGYIRYVLLSDRIEAEKLFNDVPALEKAGYAALAKTFEEKALVDESKRLSLSAKLVDFALTPVEWKEYRQLTSQVRHPGESRGPGSETISGGESEGLDSGFRRNDEGYPDLSSFEAFYVEAAARNDALAGRLLDALPSAQSPLPSVGEGQGEGAHRPAVAVLVTGGFHGKEVEERLLKRGAAVVTYVPKLTKVDLAEGTSYLSVFNREKTPLEKLFAGERLFTAPHPSRAGVAEGAAHAAALTGVRRGPKADVQAPYDALDADPATREKARLLRANPRRAVVEVNGATGTAQVTVETGETGAIADSSQEPKRGWGDLLAFRRKPKQAKPDEDLRIAAAKPSGATPIGMAEDPSYVEEKAPARENREFFWDLGIWSGLSSLILGSLSFFISRVFHFSIIESAYDPRIWTYGMQIWLISILIVFPFLLRSFVREHSVEAYFYFTEENGQQIEKRVRLASAAARALERDMKKRGEPVKERLKRVTAYYQFEGGKWILKMTEPHDEEKIQRLLLAKGWRIFTPILFSKMVAPAAGLLAAPLLGFGAVVLFIVLEVVGTIISLEISRGLHEGENRPADGNIAAAMPARPFAGKFRFLRAVAALIAFVLWACGSKDEPYLDEPLEATGGSAGAGYAAPAGKPGRGGSPATGGAAGKAGEKAIGTAGEQAGGAAGEAGAGGAGDVATGGKGGKGGQAGETSAGATGEGGEGGGTPMVCPIEGEPVTVYESGNHHTFMGAESPFRLLPISSNGEGGFYIVDGEDATLRSGSVVDALQTIQRTGDQLFVLERGRLVLLDAGDRLNPVVAAEQSWDTALVDGNTYEVTPVGMRADGDDVYVLLNYKREGRVLRYIHAYRFTGASAGQEVGRFPVGEDQADEGGWRTDMPSPLAEWAGGNALVVDAGPAGGIQILSKTDLGRVLHTIPWPGSDVSLAVAGDRLFVISMQPSGAFGGAVLTVRAHNLSADDPSAREGEATLGTEIENVHQIVPVQYADGRVVLFLAAYYGMGAVLASEDGRDFSSPRVLPSWVLSDPENYMYFSRIQQVDVLEGHKLSVIYSEGSQGSSQFYDGGHRSYIIEMDVCDPAAIREVPSTKRLLPRDFLAALDGDLGVYVFYRWGARGGEGRLEDGTHEGTMWDVHFWNMKTDALLKNAGFGNLSTFSSPGVGGGSPFIPRKKEIRFRQDGEYIEVPFDYINIVQLGGVVIFDRKGNVRSSFWQYQAPGESEARGVKVLEATVNPDGSADVRFRPMTGGEGDYPGYGAETTVHVDNPSDGDGWWKEPPAGAPARDRIAGAKPIIGTPIGAAEDAGYVEKRAPTKENREFFTTFLSAAGGLSLLSSYVVRRFFPTLAPDLADLYLGSFLISAVIIFPLALRLFVFQHRADVVSYEEFVDGEFVSKSITALPGKGFEVSAQFKGSDFYRNVNVREFVATYYQFEKGRWILKEAEAGSEEEARVQRELYAKGWRIFSPVFLLAVGAGLAGFVASQLIGPWGGLVAVVAGTAGFGPIYRASLGIHEAENRPFDGNVAAAMPGRGGTVGRRSYITRLAALAAAFAIACGSRSELPVDEKAGSGQSAGAVGADGGRGAEVARGGSGGIRESGLPRPRMDLPGFPESGGAAGAAKSGAAGRVEEGVAPTSESGGTAGRVGEGGATATEEGYSVGYNLLPGLILQIEVRKDGQTLYTIEGLNGDELVPYPKPAEGYFVTPEGHLVLLVYGAHLGGAHLFILDEGDQPGVGRVVQEFSVRGTREPGEVGPPIGYTEEVSVKEVGSGYVKVLAEGKEQVFEWVNLPDGRGLTRAEADPLYGIATVEDDQGAVIELWSIPEGKVNLEEGDLAFSKSLPGRVWPGTGFTPDGAVWVLDKSPENEAGRYGDVRFRVYSKTGEVLADEEVGRDLNPFPIEISRMDAGSAVLTFTVGDDKNEIHEKTITWQVQAGRDAAPAPEHRMNSMWPVGVMAFGAVVMALGAEVVGVALIAAGFLWMLGDLLWRLIRPETAPKSADGKAKKSPSEKSSAARPQYRVAALALWAALGVIQAGGPVNAQDMARSVVALQGEVQSVGLDQAGAAANASALLERWRNELDDEEFHSVMKQVAEEQGIAVPREGDIRRSLETHLFKGAGVWNAGAVQAAHEAGKIPVAQAVVLSRADLDALPAVLEAHKESGYVRILAAEGLEEAARRMAGGMRLGERAVVQSAGPVVLDGEEGPILALAAMQEGFLQWTRTVRALNEGDYSLLLALPRGVGRDFAGLKADDLFFLAKVMVLGLPRVGKMLDLKNGDEIASHIARMA